MGYDQSAVEFLRQKISDNPSLNVEFLVGPGFNNPLLEDLAKEGKIELIHLKDKSPVDCRVIDGVSTYTSGVRNGRKEYLWTSGNFPALKDRIKVLSTSGYL